MGFRWFLLILIIIKSYYIFHYEYAIIFIHDLYQLFLGGFQIPPGTSLGFCIIAMGTNPQHFPAPFEFKPERFENRNSSNPYDYIPFSAGPRNCIGL